MKNKNNNGMEILEQTLKTIENLRKTKKMTPKEAKAYFIGTATTLSYLNLINEMQINYVLPNMIGKIK